MSTRITLDGNPTCPHCAGTGMHVPITYEPLGGWLGGFSEPIPGDPVPCDCSAGQAIEAEWDAMAARAAEVDYAY